MKRNSFNHFWGHVVQQSKLSSSWEKEERSLQATQIVKQQRNDYRCGKNGSAFRNWPRSLLKMPIKSIEIIEGKIFRFANAIFLITRKNFIYVCRRQSHNAMRMQCMIVSLTKLKSQTYFSTVKNHRKIHNSRFLWISEWLHAISAYFFVSSLLRTNKVTEFLMQYVCKERYVSRVSTLI